jgi:hypothetical protein
MLTSAEARAVARLLEAAGDPEAAAAASPTTPDDRDAGVVDPGRTSYPDARLYASLAEEGVSDETLLGRELNDALRD